MQTAVNIGVNVTVNGPVSARVNTVRSDRIHAVESERKPDESGYYKPAAYRCGLSTTVASGGRVMRTEAGRPWLSALSAMTPAPLPAFEPP